MALYDTNQSMTLPPPCEPSGFRGALCSSPPPTTQACLKKRMPLPIATTACMSCSEDDDGLSDIPLCLPCPTDETEIAWGKPWHSYVDAETRNPGSLKHMQKKDYEKLAAAVRDMREGFRLAVAQDGGPSTDELMEIVIARLGLALAKENTSFNSMVFEAVCKGGKAPR